MYVRHRGRQIFKDAFCIVWLQTQLNMLSTCCCVPNAFVHGTGAAPTRQLGEVRCFSDGFPICLL